MNQTNRFVRSVASVMRSIPKINYHFRLFVANFSLSQPFYLFFHYLTKHSIIDHNWTTEYCQSIRGDGDRCSFRPQQSSVCVIKCDLYSRYVRVWWEAGDACWYSRYLGDRNASEERNPWMVRYSFRIICSQTTPIFRTMDWGIQRNEMQKVIIPGSSMEKPILKSTSSRTDLLSLPLFACRRREDMDLWVIGRSGR